MSDSISKIVAEMRHAATYDKASAEERAILVGFADRLLTMSSLRQLPDGITAAWVLGYLPTDISSPYSDEYINGHNDCSKLCREEVAHAFAEWRELNPATPTSGECKHDVCCLAKPTGITCADGECDIASGVRPDATPAQAGADDGRLNDPAPPHKLPEWHECKNVIDDYEFHLSVLAGNEGQQLATIDPTPRAPTELERFIHEYDDASVYRSGWFMHRLEKLLDWHANEIRAQAGAIAWESTTVGYIKYITDDRYQKFGPEIRKWYKPYRCTNCAQAGAELPELPAPTKRERHWDGETLSEWYTADQMRDMYRRGLKDAGA